MKDKKYGYQMVIVLNPKAEGKEKVLDGVVARIGAMSAEVVKRNGLGIKELVYEIKGFDKGDFWELTVESSKPLKMGELNLMLNRDINILRYLILKI